jgi:predicted MFS family arabinose efflux permease
MVVTLTSGGFMTYLPIIRPDGALATIALLVWGALAAAIRWRVGLLADRIGLRALLPISSVLSIVGVCVVTGGLLLSGGTSWVVILVGSAILGTGFGGTQNLTLVAAFARARQRETATVSSVWNIGFDTGTALGSGLVGLLILVVTIPSALALTSLLIVASMPMAVRATRPVHA